jgi:RepB DNA-primase N-terminal domain/AAA domain
MTLAANLQELVEVLAQLNEKSNVPSQTEAISDEKARAEFDREFADLVPAATEDVTLDPTDTLGYLKRLFEPSDWIDIHFIHQTQTWADDSGRTRICVDDNFMTLADALKPETVTRIQQAQGQGWNVYVAMNAFTPGVRHRRVRDVKEVRSLYIEFDENGREGLERIRADVAAGTIPAPDFVIESSPSKFHVIWRVQGFDVAQQQALNSALQKRYGSDPASVDAARVLRLPGTRNLKPAYSPTPTARILEYRACARHVPAEFKVDFEVNEIKEAQSVASEKLAIILNKVIANLDEAKVAYSQPEPYENGFKIVLDECLWGRAKDHHQNGNPGDAAVFIDESGRLGYHCFHTYCAEHYHWAEFRAELEKRVGHKLNFDDALELLVRGEPIEKRAQEAKRAQQALAQSQAPAVASWRSKFRNIAEMDQGNPVMIIEGVLQDGTCFLGAAPGHGKTLVALAMAKAISLGTNLFELPEFSVKTPYPVIYLIPETSDRPFRKRCEAFRIPADDRFIARTITEGASLKLTDPELLEAVRQLKPVIVLDTARRFNSSSDTNSDAENQKLVSNIIDLRAAGAVCVIILHHSTKAANQKKQAMTLENMLSGTGDFGAMCDQAFGIRMDENLYNRGSGPMEVEVVNLKDRERLGGLTSLRLAATYKKDGNVFPQSWIDETGNFRPIGDRETMEQNTKRLVDLVKTHPAMTVTELVEGTGIKKYTVQQTLKALGWHRTKGGPDGASPWHLDANGKCPYEKPQPKTAKPEKAIKLDQADD